MKETGYLVIINSKDKWIFIWYSSFHIFNDFMFLNSFPIGIQLLEVSRDKDTDYQPCLIQSAPDFEIHLDISAITLDLETGYLGSKTPALLLNQSKVLPFCHFLATTSVP